MKRSLTLHVILPGLYALIFFLSFRRQPILFAQFMIGVYLGFGLLLLDRLLHVFFIAPDTEHSQQIRLAWKGRHFSQVARALMFSQTVQQRLITRSVLFLVAYVGLALFVVTSTGSVLGEGVVLGIGLHYCFDFFLYRRNLELLHQHFLWQLKRRLAEQEVTALFFSMCTFFVLLTLLVYAGR